MLTKTGKLISGFLLALGLCGSGWAFSKVTFSSDSLFAKNSVQLDATARSSLLSFAEKCDNASPEVVWVIGHADKNENDPQGLSQRRAKAVKFYLMQLGVAPSLIYAVGKGSLQPTMPSLSDKNRRVELEFVGLVGSFESGRGFALMNAWKLDGDPSSSNQDEWFGVGPIDFANRIADQQAKRRFANQLALVAIHRNNDVLLRVAIAMRGGKAFWFDRASSAPLYALAFGSSFARESLAGEIAAIPLDAPERIDLAELSWCDKTGNRTQVVQALLVTPRSVESWLAKQQRRRVSCAASRDSILDLRWLMQQGLSLDVADVDGKTPLHMAILNDDVIAVRSLLSAGVSLSLADALGNTPLHFIHQAYSSRFMIPNPNLPFSKQQLWKVLLDAGADPTAKNAKGEVPVQPPQVPDLKVN